MSDYKEVIERLLRLDSHPESAPKQAADALRAVTAKYEAAISERPYIVGWNAGFDYAEHADETRAAPDVVKAMAKKLTAEQCVEVRPRVRHIKSGSTYQVLAYGKIQTGRPLSDYAGVTVYRSEYDGMVWVRPIDEFNDPNRFEDLPPKEVNKPRPASEVYTKGFAAGIEAAADELMVEALSCEGDTSVEKAQQAILNLHTTDTLAAIDLIKAQARQEERERCAKIAEGFGCCHVPAEIAKAIRDGE